MSLSTQTASIIHTGNGVTTVFSVPFLFYDSDDVIVVLENTITQTEEVLSPALYTITGANVSTGGTITYPVSGVPMTSYYKLRIVRKIPLTQDLVVGREGGFDPTAAEKQLDRIVMMIQQQAAETNIHEGALDPHPQYLTPADATLIQKGDTGDGFLFLPNAAALRATDTGGANPVMVADVMFEYKGASVAADDGVNVIIDSAGKRYVNIGWTHAMPWFDHRGLAAAANIPAYVKRLTLGGYAALTAGGALAYVEVTNTGPVEYWQFQSNGGTRRWEIDERSPTMRQFGATGVSTNPTAVTVNDLIPAQQLVAYAKTHLHTVPDFSGVWGINAGLLIDIPVIANNQFNFKAGCFVALAGSTGDALVTVDTDYASWSGELGAIGNGGATFTARGWVTGIDCKSTRGDGGQWVAENFKRNGLYHNGVGAVNGISSNFGSGRVRNCGPLIFGGVAELKDTFTAVVRSGSFSSLAQTCVLTMTNDVPAECLVDDIVFLPEPAVVLGPFSGTGAVQLIQLPESATQKEWLTVTVGGVPTTTYTLAEKNVMSITAAVGVNNISITVQPWRPHTVQGVAGKSLTIYPWIMGNPSTGTLIYGYGAGIHSSGGNTANTNFDKVDAISCSTDVKVDGLYCPSFESLQSQSCGIHLAVGNPPNSFSAGLVVTANHSESSVYDLVTLSGGGVRGHFGWASGLAGASAAASGSYFAQVWQVAPLASDTAWSSTYSFIESLAFAYDEGVIQSRQGMHGSLRQATIELSNLPTQNDANQILDSGTLSLKFYPDAERAFRGYTKVQYEVFGTATNGGPTGNTTVQCAAVDVGAGYTVNGGASVVVPPNKLGFPLRIIAVLDRGSTGTGKNWKVTYEVVAPSLKAMKSYALNPAAFTGTQIQTTPLVGAQVGDMCVANFSLYGAWRVEGLAVTVVDEARFQFVEMNGGANVDPGAGVAGVGILL